MGNTTRQLRTSTGLGDPARPLARAGRRIGRIGALASALVAALAVLAPTAAHGSRPDPDRAPAADEPARAADSPRPTARATAAVDALMDAARAAASGKASADAAGAPEQSPNQGMDRAIAAVAALGQDSIAAVRAHLERERASTDDDRRAVLRAIKADVPDQKGRFRVPGRKSKDQVRREDDFDWLAELVSVPRTHPELARLGGAAALADVIADVAAIRALAASKAPAAADVILDLGFSDLGLIYRDECGRYLRRMAPYSLPALIAGVADRARPGALRRYASYQLDRLDRQNPFKVLSDAAVSESLTVAVVEAYGASKHREAVPAVLSLVGDGSPRVRKVARAAWMGYVTGPAPPPAPKRKLTMPGGKLSDEEQPLWLTYRELADVELRRKLEESKGEKPPRRAKLDELSAELFAHYDAARDKAAAEALARADEAAAAGDAQAAVAIYDRLLAENPEHPARAEMARTYLSHARALDKAGSFAEAASAYGKAHDLAPEAPFADDALARHYYALGKALEAQGKDGAAAFRRAAGTNPDDPEVAAAAEPAAQSKWMLYAGVGGGAGAVILLIVGLALRRRG